MVAAVAGYVPALHETAGACEVAQLLLRAAAASSLCSEGADDASGPSGLHHTEADRIEEVSPEVLWLAGEAASCPPPAGWLRCRDEWGRELFVHEFGAFPPRRQHPLLSYFAGLTVAVQTLREEGVPAALAVLANAEQSISASCDEILATWTGPFHPQHGGRLVEWRCATKGWTTCTDPEAAPSHLLRVVKRLAALVQNSDASKEPRLRQPALVEAPQAPINIARKRPGCTPSTAESSRRSPPSTTAPTVVTPGLAAVTPGLRSQVGGATASSGAAEAWRTPAQAASKDPRARSKDRSPDIWASDSKWHSPDAIARHRDAVRNSVRCPRGPTMPPARPGAGSPVAARQAKACTWFSMVSPASVEQPPTPSSGGGAAKAPAHPRHFSMASPERVPAAAPGHVQPVARVAAGLAVSFRVGPPASTVSPLGAEALTAPRASKASEERAKISPLSLDDLQNTFDRDWAQHVPPAGDAAGGVGTPSPEPSPSVRPQRLDFQGCESALGHPAEVANGDASGPQVRRSLATEFATPSPSVTTASSGAPGSGAAGGQERRRSPPPGALACESRRLQPQRVARALHVEFASPQSREPSPSPARPPGVGAASAGVASGAGAKSGMRPAPGAGASCAGAASMAGASGAGAAPGAGAVSMGTGASGAGASLGAPGRVTAGAGASPGASPLARCTREAARRCGGPASPTKARLGRSPRPSSAAPPFTGQVAAPVLAAAAALQANRSIRATGRATVGGDARSLRLRRTGSDQGRGGSQDGRVRGAGFEV